jgi:hypothetical protein
MIPETGVMAIGAAVKKVCFFACVNLCFLHTEDTDVALIGVLC